MKHKSVTIRLPNDKIVNAVAPVILSISRATDIPAFYPDWILNRLKEGYCGWTNPYTKQIQYVSFENVKGIVFWTKNPSERMYDVFSFLNDKGIDYYVQYTLNNYESEGFEPKLPPLWKRIDSFKRLSDKIGKERVIWRFDPLILTPKLTPIDLVGRVKEVGDSIKGYTDKLVFSFIDIACYKRVQHNMVKESGSFTYDNIENAEFDVVDSIKTASMLSELRDAWKTDGWDIELATCGEKINLKLFGITHNRCVDAELFKKITTNVEFLNFLNYGELNSEPTLFGKTPLTNENLKDRGQRLQCGCMLSKDIGAYNTCPHFCVYCYANASRECVMDKIKNINQDNIVL